MITSLRRSALVESRCGQTATRMRFGKLGLIHFIILVWVRTLFSPFDGVEAENKTVYAVGINCVPGTFITNAGCQKCPNGTFSDKNNATKCSPCDKCVGRHNEVVEPCTRSTNTKCSCQSGYYYNAQIQFCIKCTPCKKGQGVVTNCTATSNTKCALCAKGQTFSGEKNLEGCKPCLRCAEGHIEQKKCTRRTDTVCAREKDKNNSKVPRIPKVSTGTLFTRPPQRNRTTTTKKKRWKTPTIPVSTEPISAQNQSTTVPNQEADTGSEDDTGLQLALYSLIAVVVVLIFVCVLVCHYRKRRNRPRKKPKPGGEEPSTRSNSTDVIEAVENPYSSLPFISKPGQEKMLRDVPYTLISDLSFHLNPGERWKQLGGQLKFNSTQINTFALVKGNATQAMLGEWGQKDGSTVVALQNTFRKMRWGKEERMVAKYV